MKPAALACIATIGYPSAVGRRVGKGAAVEWRQLGDSGLRVAEIGLGCMGMSAVYEPGTKNDDDSVEVIRRAIDLGVTLFDTSDVYGPYTNEKLLGRAIAGRRDEVVVATKAGCVFRPEHLCPCARLPPRAPEGVLRRVARPVGRGRDRPVAAAPARSGGTHRGVGGGDG